MKPHLKYILLILVLCSCRQILVAQQNKADSLVVLIKNDKPDTNKINHLNALAWTLMYNNPDTSIIIDNEALLLAQKLQWKKGIANCYTHLGSYHSLISNYPKALDYYLQALTIDEGLKDNRRISRRFTNIGLVYYDLNNYSKALDYLLKALKITEEFQDENLSSVNLGNLGIVYEVQENYSKALDCYLKALKIAEKLGNKNRIALNLGNIGNIYKAQSDYIKALDYNFKALKIEKELGNTNGITRSLANIGAIYIKTKDFLAAEKYLKESLKLCHEIQELNYTMRVEQSLSDLYVAMGKYKPAMEHYKKQIELNDSIFNKEKSKEITRREMNYEFDKKEAATKAEQDKKDIIVKAELKQKEQQRNYFIFGFAVLALFVIIILRGYRQKQKANLIITEQKSEVENQKRIIEEKNKGITDSINYARRIQQAKLPKKEEIYASLPNSFVLFKPKDIVSGDFYFFHKSNQCVFLVVADCTGHGVPGALMSMIGSEQLSEAVSQNMEASKILEHLNRGIKTSLRQSDDDESTRDGMDIAICEINTKNRIIKYAGANRPIWYIRKGQMVIEEVKATKKAIGGLTHNDQEFESHELKLHEGDTFYICTDGYADQFNGQSGKKLMTKKLKEILIEIQPMPMPEQENYLNNFIENWKVGTEQIDDILVVGVRL